MSGPARLAALLLLALAACAAGRGMPDLEAVHLDGSPFRTAEVRGRSAWFEFWAPWDPASRQRLAEVRGLLDLHPDWAARLQVITVAVNCQPAEVRQALGPAREDRFRMVVETGDFARDMGVLGVPATLLVDSQGRYRSLREGYVEPAVLERAVADLVAEGSAAVGK